MMSLRKFAKMAGWSLILMAIISGISIGYAYGEVYKALQLETLTNNGEETLKLFQILIWGISVILILDLIVAYALYRFFLFDNKPLSMLSAFFRVGYTFIFAIAFYFLLRSFPILLTNKKVAIDNFDRFQFIWTCGLVVFGLHLIGIGILMKLHKKIPGILWLITIIAGVSYAVLHLLKITTPSSKQLITVLQLILVLPMMAGELGLAIWLIIKGGKASY